MSHWMSQMSSSLKWNFMPSGGVFVSAVISFIRLWMTAGERFSAEACSGGGKIGWKIGQGGGVRCGREARHREAKEAKAREVVLGDSVRLLRVRALRACRVLRCH